MSKEKEEKDIKKNDASKYVNTEPTEVPEYDDEEELDEASLTISQRRQRANAMRKNKSKIAAGRRKAKNKKASADKLKKRARKKAIDMIKKRLSKNKNYKDMSDSEKRALDKRLEKISSSTIDKLAKKVLPQVRRAEQERMKTKNEGVIVEADDLIESYAPMMEGIATGANIELETVLEAFVNGVDAWEGGDIAPDTMGLDLVAEMLGALGAEQYGSLPANARIGSALIEQYLKSTGEKAANIKKIAADIIGEFDLDMDAEELADIFEANFTVAEPVNEFEIFVPKATDTLGISRSNMPQVASKDMFELINFLSKKGVSTVKKTVAAKSLKATQVDFSKDKIVSAIDRFTKAEGVGKPLLVSADGYVIDGHHRWLAAYNTNSPVHVYATNMKAKELIATLREFPKVFYKSVNESVSLDDDIFPLRESAFDILCERDESCPIITQTTMQAFEKIVDKLFARFKIGFSFSKHFRERLGDNRNRPCIDMKELAEMLKRLYAMVKSGKETLSKHLDTEVVLKDIQTHLNIPVAVEYDRKKDELDVRCKTVMRKKAFSTPNKIVTVK